jgi:hypothetical protein
VRSDSRPLAQLRDSGFKLQVPARPISCVGSVRGEVTVLATISRFLLQHAFSRTAPAREIESSTTDEVEKRMPLVCCKSPI